MVRLEVVHKLVEVGRDPLLRARVVERDVSLVIMEGMEGSYGKKTHIVCLVRRRPLVV